MTHLSKEKKEKKSPTNYLPFRNTTKVIKLALIFGSDDFAILKDVKHVSREGLQIFQASRFILW